MPRFYVLFFITVPLYAAQQPTPALPSEVWGLIIKRLHPTGADRLKQRGTLQVVSKTMAAQQPTIAELDLTQQEVEKFLWTLDKYTTSLAHLHLTHKFQPVAQENIPQEWLRVSKNLLHQVLDMDKKLDTDTGNTDQDSERAKCIARACVHVTNQSGKLLFSMIPYSSGTKECERRKQLTHYLIDAGDSVAYADEKGTTALHKAIDGPVGKIGQRSVVQHLLEKGADLNAVSSEFTQYGKRITAFDHGVMQSVYTYYRWNTNSGYEWTDNKLAVKHANMTEGQKLVLVGIAYSPSSDKVSQIFNNYWNDKKHLLVGAQLSPQQVKALCALKADEKKKYLTMDSQQARAYEEKMNSMCRIL